ncbi:hypothetical protein GCM10023201_21800 [Actinomycetospora corticicola]|uniref:Carbonic anhydrase n=1 Tax=Actinomycetospora corticicola TaxID=663602 RepID=A0A7Y9J3I9_9PSEU|nr:hypothetical protein [Actinomycetospora corticicola]
MNAFPDAEQDVRDSIKRVTDSPFIKNEDSVRCFVLDVATGKLNEVR